MLLSDKEYIGFILNVGLKIGYYRRKAGMTQQEVAEVAEISVPYLGTLESQNKPHHAPSLKTLLKLGKVLGVEPYKFLDVND